MRLNASATTQSNDDRDNSDTQHLPWATWHVVTDLIFKGTRVQKRYYYRSHLRDGAQMLSHPHKDPSLAEVEAAFGSRICALNHQKHGLSNMTPIAHTRGARSP